jgi:type II secretory pathway pseudopilin PulG
MMINFKFQISNFKSSRGFTLVEILGSVLVLIAIGSVIAGVIASSLRSTSKTNSIESIRQVGNYALNQISKNIQYAQVFDGLKTNEAGSVYTASCPISTPTPPALPEVVKTSFNYIKVTPLNSNSIEYKCIPPAPPSTVPIFTVNDTVSEKEIIDTNQFDLKDCSITCTQTYVTDVPIIGIRFTVGLKNVNNGFVESNNTPIVFETSITIRNYRR